MMYYGGLAIGFFGAIIGRFQPLGIARVMIVTALALVLVAIITLISGRGSTGPIWPRDIVPVTGFFAAIWLGSALLFWQSALEQLQASEGPGR